METELILTRGGFPPLSARGCSQELSPIALGQFHRTINGNLVFLGVQGKKYRSLITCRDQTAFASDDLYPGLELEVSCIQRLWQKALGNHLILERDPVMGSVLATDVQRQPVEIIEHKNREVTVSSSQGSYVGYRPILKMRVISYALTTHEWQKLGGWRLELEEI